MKSLALALLLTVPGTWLLPAGAGGQDPLPHPDARRHRPDLSGQVATLSANAALGGLAAGIVQKLRGGSFQDGLARGALGGGVAFLGKRVAVERFDGAGLAGRQLAAVGNSILLNAGAGRPSLERLVLPVGFARLHLGTGEEPRARVSLDLHGLVWTAYAAAVPELRFDAAASLSAGAPVFRSPGYVLSWDETGDEVAGFAPAGVILLSDHTGREGRGGATDPVIFAHERVHVLQYDQSFAAWSDPLQGWLLPRLPGGERVGRVLDLDLAAPLLYGVSLWHGGYEGRPWEREAYFLAGR